MYTDDDTLARAAEESLTRPSDAAFWDDRLYTTHGGTLTWAERMDDPLAESNYLSVLAYLESVAEEDDDVLDISARHWLVGSLRQIYVRVYREDGTYTTAFREVTAIATALREDYPVFDEADYAEREWRAFKAQLADAFASEARDLDTVAQDQEIAARATKLAAEGAWYGGNASDLYTQARDAYYTDRARAQYDLTESMEPLI